MIYYILSCVGLTFIAKYGSILEWIRRPLRKIDYFDQLFNCSLCIGFWSGCYIGCIGWFIEDDPKYILMPLISSTCCWFADVLIGVLQSFEIYLDNKK